MVTINDLPNEIILIILKNENISLRDVENFSSTCKAFQWISHYKNLWKEKYAQRWPTALVFCKEEMGIEFGDVNIENLKKGMKCAEDLWLYVSHMSDNEMYNMQLKNESIMPDAIKQFFNLHINKYRLNRFILFDELVRNIYQQDPRQCNLTERYNSIILLQYLNQQIFDLKWSKFKENSNQVQLLENIIVVILRRHHPDKFITILRIDKFIDNFVHKVLKFLKDKYPPHPILSISSEQFSIWKNNHIDKNFWCEKDAMSIKYALDKIIVSFESYESWMEPNQINTNLTYKFRQIEKDALSYRHVLWLIIYVCVAKRLGLHVVLTAYKLTNSVTDIHLVWQSRNCTENIEFFTFEWTNGQDNVKISDIKECGQVSPLHEIEPHLPQSRKTYKIMNVYELYYDHFKSINNLTSFYSHWNESPNFSSRHVKRLPDLKYAIGLIVKYKTYDNTGINITAGVIVGWQYMRHIQHYPQARTLYDSLNNTKKEYVQREQYNIKAWNWQPSYALLVEDNVCYVPQCDIISICEEWINNSETGRYFCKFEGTHYVPNNKLSHLYPNDAAVVREILSSRK